MSWTIYKLDGDGVDIIPATKEGMGGWRTQAVNGSYPTKLAALEAALRDAIEERGIARSRVRKLRAKLRRQRPTPGGSGK